MTPTLSSFWLHLQERPHTSDNHLAELSQLTEPWEVIWSYCCQPPNLQVFSLCSNRKLQNTTPKMVLDSNISFSANIVFMPEDLLLGFHPTHSSTKHVFLPFFKYVSCSFHSNKNLWALPWRSGKLGLQSVGTTVILAKSLDSLKLEFFSEKWWGFDF